MSALMQSHTMLETIDGLDFEPLNLEPAQNIGALSAVSNWQLISIKGKVTQLSGIKAQSTRYGMKRKLKLI